MHANSEVNTETNRITPGQWTFMRRGASTAGRRVLQPRDGQGVWGIQKNQTPVGISKRARHENRQTSQRTKLERTVLWGGEVNALVSEHCCCCWAAYWELEAKGGNWAGILRWEFGRILQALYSEGSFRKNSIIDAEIVMERCVDENWHRARLESWRDAWNHDYAMSRTPGANSGVAEPIKIIR